MKSIESVEEFFLNILFACNELDVVDKNTIEIAVLVFELIHVFGFESVDKVVAEGFGGKIANFEIGILFEKFVADGLHKMGFADSYPTPDEEWIVEKTGSFGDTLGGSKGKIVAIANN